MSLVLSLRADQLTDPQLPQGTGDKLLLRAALALLGLTEAAGRPKRAIQFGSRLSKLYNMRAFGSNTRANKAHAGQRQIQGKLDHR